MSSELYTPTFADPRYALERPGGKNVTRAAGYGTPTGLALPAAGYEKGATFQDLTNGNLYRNTGTTSVAVWTIMLGAGDTAATLTVTTLTVSTTATLPAAATTGGVLTPGVSAPVAVAAATTTLTLTPAAHANRVVLLASTGGLVITPPAATGTGNVYSLIVGTTISGGNVTLDAKLGNASDKFAGMCWMILSGGVTQTAFPTVAGGSPSNLITWNGTTTGGVQGSWLQIVDVATNLWFVQIEALQTSTGATPFSNH